MRVTILILAVLTTTLTTVQSSNNARIVCYYRSGAVFRPGEGSYHIEDIPADLCTHIIYSFIGLTDGTNEVLILNPQYDVDESGFYNFTSLRSIFPDVKYSVALGGWAEDGFKYSQMVSKNTSRTSFIRNIVDFLEKYEFDGLDLHWEYPGALDRNGTVSDKDNFLSLVQEMKAAFIEVGKNWELTAVVPLIESKVNAGYHVRELCQELDAVHVEGYDLRGISYRHTDVHSPLYNSSSDLPGFEKINVNDGLNLWEEKGCSPNKLVVGIPFYGRSFTLLKGSKKYDIGTKINKTAGGGDPGPYTNERGLLAYYEICSVVDKQGSSWTKKWDKHGKCPYAYKGTQWVGYEDKNSVEIKMNWIKKKGYLGAMTWSIDMDDFYGLCGKQNPLIQVINKHMSSYFVPTPSTSTTTKTVLYRVKNKTDIRTTSNTTVSTSTSVSSAQSESTSDPPKESTAPSKVPQPDKAPMPKGSAAPSKVPQPDKVPMPKGSPVPSKVSPKYESEASVQTTSSNVQPSATPIESKPVANTVTIKPISSNASVSSHSSSTARPKFLILFAVNIILYMYSTTLLQLSR